MKRSFAAVVLATGSGALILFGCVQPTTILAAVRDGDVMRGWTLMDIGLAFGGLVLLVLPGLTAPSPSGSLLMAVAGLAWGMYTLRGRGYSLWYTALPAMSTTLASVLQLLVQVQAALGGVLFMGEVLSPRLLVTAAMVLAEFPWC